MADPAMGEPLKRQTRMTYDQGPMGFLADQIVKEMQRAGYPARRYQLYRTASEQAVKKSKGLSKAAPYQSAHQYYGAADIAHEKWAWFADDKAPDGTEFWNRLWDCVEVVAERYGVDFEPRIPWDPAHVELSEWRELRDVVGREEPSATALRWWFARVLPAVWKQHERAQLKKMAA